MSAHAAQLLVFVAWTALTAWIVFHDGAEVLEGWGAAIVLGSFWAALLEAPHLRLYAVVLWIGQLVGLLVSW